MVSASTSTRSQHFGYPCITADVANLQIVELLTAAIPSYDLSVLQWSSGIPNLDKLTGSAIMFRILCIIQHTGAGKCSMQVPDGTV